MLIDVLRLADRYDLMWLVCECEIQLTPCVTPSNVCAVLATADRHRADQLKEFCVARASTFLKAGFLGPGSAESEFEDLDPGLKDCLEGVVVVGWRLISEGFGLGMGSEFWFRACDRLS